LDESHKTISQFSNKESKEVLLIPINKNILKKEKIKFAYEEKIIEDKKEMEPTKEEDEEELPKNCDITLNDQKVIYEKLIEKIKSLPSLFEITQFLKKKRNEITVQTEDQYLFAHLIVYSFVKVLFIIISNNLNY